VRLTTKIHGRAELRSRKHIRTSEPDDETTEYWYKRVYTAAENAPKVLTILLAIPTKNSKMVDNGLYEVKNFVKFHFILYYVGPTYE
jgi:hypothetical protein